MDFIFRPWQFYLAILAGWVNRQQQFATEYLRTENQVLREQFGRKRILLTDDQRRRLAVKGKILGRKMLQEIGTVFTPDTILRWHRELVARKWDIERFMKSLKTEALSRMIFFGEKSLRRAVEAYLQHYHAERNHQGLDNELIQPGDEIGQVAGKITCRERLGGLLKYYHRKAA